MKVERRAYYRITWNQEYIKCKKASLWTLKYHAINALSMKQRLNKKKKNTRHVFA